MNTEEALAAFQVGWQEYNGQTRTVMRRQQVTLRNLCDGGDLLSCDADKLRGYLQRRIADGISPGRVEADRKQIRPFFTWAFQEQLISAEHFLRIKGVRPPRGVVTFNPRPYSKKERVRFWADFDRRYPWVRDVYGTRDQYRGINTAERGRMFFERWMEERSVWRRAYFYCARLQAEAIVNLAMHGGLRRIEIYNLDLDDMDPDNEYLIVHSARKGDGLKKDRAVPWVSTALRDSIDAWLTVRSGLASRLDTITHDRPWIALWSNGDRKVGERMRFKKFDKTMRELGPWEFHRMRHTAATEMLRAGIPLASVSKILGHTSVVMTQRYVQLLREDLVHDARRGQARFDKQMET